MTGPHLNPELVRAEADSVTRRLVLTSAAWAVPVIAMSIAAPAAAASVDTAPATPLTCTKHPNHGHGGNTGNAWWVVNYSDGSTATLDNGTVMSNKVLKRLCKP